MSEEMQETFDWTQESADVVEGIKFDSDTEYNFELMNIDSKMVVIRTGKNAGQKRKVIDLKWAEMESNASFKMSVWVNEKERVNPSNPEMESDNVKLGRRMGYNPMLGGKFSFHDFLRIGLKIQAKVAPVTSKGADGTERTFNNIDVNTISLVGDVGDGQQQIKEAVPEAIAKEIKALAKGCKKLSDLTTKINQLAKKDPAKFQLLQPAMQMSESGEIKF